MGNLEHSNLFKEIHEQGKIISDLINGQNDNIKILANEIKKRNIGQVLIAARGTSDNAARYAKYLLGTHNKMNVSLATPSLYTIYKQPPDLSNTLVIGISQSGKSPDIVSVVKEGKKQGLLTVAITNSPNSDLANKADINIDLNAGEELSLAATKTYTAQLVVLALLSTEINNKSEFSDELKNLPILINKVLENKKQILTLAKHYKLMKHCLIIGRGYNFSSACEFALKLKELTYTIAEPYSSADLLHGPIALIEKGLPVFILAPDGKMTQELFSLTEQVKKREAEILMISNQQKLLKLGDLAYEIPTDLPEWLSPILAIIPAQIFTMYLASIKGIDVDNPRGLSKVTETW